MEQIKRLKYFIDGEWVESKTEKYMPVYNPSTGEVIAETPCCTSEEVEAAMKGLRRFMFDNVYRNRVAKREEEKAVEMVKRLYEYYSENLELLPDEYKYLSATCGISKEQIVCDYIAGMTDTYAVKKFQELFVPQSWNN